jgi:hypothetical protein
MAIRKVPLLPQHDALLDVIGDGLETAESITQAARKPARPELAGYYAPLAIRVHLDQLVAWGLLEFDGSAYQRA